MNDSFFVSDEVHNSYMKRIEEAKKKLGGRKIGIDPEFLKMIKETKRYVL